MPLAIIAKVGSMTISFLKSIGQYDTNANDKFAEAHNDQAVLYNNIDRCISSCEDWSTCIVHPLDIASYSLIIHVYSFFVGWSHHSMNCPYMLVDMVGARIAYEQQISQTFRSKGLFKLWLALPSSGSECWCNLSAFDFRYDRMLKQLELWSRCHYFSSLILSTISVTLFWYMLILSTASRIRPCSPRSAHPSARFPIQLRIISRSYFALLGLLLSKQSGLSLSSPNSRCLRPNRLHTLSLMAPVPVSGRSIRHLQ